jgi:DNA invertase Pin-like site-specific DNA recombinase
MGKAMFTIISAIAEFERSLISERVRAGIAHARAQGKPHGRPALHTTTQAHIKRLRHEEQLSIRQIADRLRVPKSTVATYI